VAIEESFAHCGLLLEARLGEPLLTCSILRDNIFISVVDDIVATLCLEKSARDGNKEGAVVKYWAAWVDRDGFLECFHLKRSGNPLVPENSH
jgi:hypothetical protein